MSAPSALESKLGRLTSQHKDRPRFAASLAAVVAPVMDLTALLAHLPRDFDLDHAVGVQLDQVGQWVGKTRRIATPLDCYFSLGVPGLGFGEGLWKGPYSPDSGIIDLPDDIYRLILRAKVAANRWDGTAPGAYAVWREAFADKSVLFIQDNQDMSLLVGIAGNTLDAASLSLLTTGALPLKPEGVRIAYYTVSSVGGPLFGLGADNDAIGGFGHGAWARVVKPS